MRTRTINPEILLSARLNSRTNARPLARPGTRGYPFCSRRFGWGLEARHREENLTLTLDAGATGMLLAEFSHQGCATRARAAQEMVRGERGQHGGTVWRLPKCQTKQMPVFGGQVRPLGRHFEQMSGQMGQGRHAFGIHL